MSSSSASTLLPLSWPVLDEVKENEAIEWEERIMIGLVASLFSTPDEEICGVTLWEEGEVGTDKGNAAQAMAQEKRETVLSDENEKRPPPFMYARIQPTSKVLKGWEVVLSCLKEDVRHTKSQQGWCLTGVTSASCRESISSTVLARASQQGLGVAAVLKLVTRCLQGVYRPRPQLTDVDMGIASLMYIFGGSAGAYAAHKGLGLPCKRLIQKSSQWSAFVPILFTGPHNYAADIKKAVVANLHAILGQAILDRQLEWQQCFAGQWMLALDGTANDKTLSFHSQTGTVVGGCEHKPDDINLALTTVDDGEAVVEAVKRGNEDDKLSGAMHLAGETVVICFKPIGASGGDALFLPAAAVPTCNKRSCLRMSQELLTGALDGFDALRERLRAGETMAGLGDVVTIATDGDAKRRRAVTALCNSQENQVPAVDLLRDLNLFDTYGGKLRVTVDFDMRHMIKRLRVRLVFTNRGMRLSPLGVKFDRAKIEDVFTEYSVPHLASVFDNTDKQNVPAAVQLLRGFRFVADAQN
eukprot:evm.model.NODE_11708_length_39617_cov_40.337204.3